MAKYRGILRILYFVLLIVVLFIFELKFSRDTDTKKWILSPAYILSMCTSVVWLAIDDVVFKNKAKAIELKDAKTRKIVKTQFWITFFICYIIIVIVLSRILRPPFEHDGVSQGILFCGVKFSDEIIAWLYKKLSIKKAN